MDRFDSILAGVQRTKPGDSLVGRKTQAAALCKVLEEVSALYSWDRPALHSPVKKGRKAEQKLGNAVVVMTRLPEDMKELDRFLGAGVMRKKPTVREVVDSFNSKRIKSQFSGELNIALHILDTGEGMGGERGEVAQLFNGALKEMRGGVLPLTSLSTLFGTKVDIDGQCSTLVCSSRSMQRMSSSAAVQAHLAEVVIPSKVLDKSYMQGKVKVEEGVLDVEFVKCGVELSKLESRGFIRDTFFKPGQKWKESFSVWSDKSPAFSSVLLYLQHSGQCLVMDNTDIIMAVMFYQTDSSAFFCIMDKVESHFYHQLLSLDSHSPIITLTEEINTLLADIKSLQFSPSKKPVLTPKPVIAQLDISILESWRLPDIPAPQLMTSLQAATANLNSNNSSYHTLMLGVRDSYTSRGVIKGEKIKFDKEPRVIPNNSKPDITAGKLEKKLSTMSTGSTVSFGSSGAREVGSAKGGRLNLSRGEVLRQLGERNRSSVTETGDGKTEEIDSATFVKETNLGCKAGAAADLVLKMGDPNQETDDLIDNLSALKNSVVTVASFYSGVGSRNVQKFEESLNASLITGNISSLEMNSSSLDQSYARRDSTDSVEPATNRSFMLFPHLINMKRKRKDSLGCVESQGLNSSMAEFQARDKVATMDTKSPVKKVKRRLNSFSDPSDPPSFPAMCKPSTSLERVNSLTSLKPLESTCLSDMIHLGLHHMVEKDLNLSSNQIGNKTPKKGQKSPMKNFQQAEDFSSPGKKVMFNMLPQLPTPNLGLAAKSILKTPIKTQSKVAMKLSLTPKKEDSIREGIIPISRLTPGKSPARRDIGLSSGRGISLTKEELVKTPTKSAASSLSNSTIIKPTRSSISRAVPSKEENATLAALESEATDRNRNPSNASSCDNYGFPTPSPSALGKKKALDQMTHILSKEVEHPHLFREPSSEQHFLPPMMSTLQNPPLVSRACLVKEPFSELNFQPSMASTEQNLATLLPSRTNTCLDPTLQSALQPSNNTTHVSNTMPLVGSSQPRTLLTVTTKEIINSSTFMNLSTTIIKPSAEVPANIFDHSALYPAPINSTVCGVGPDSFFLVDEVVTEAAVDEAVTEAAISLKFLKTDSEHSLAAISDRTTPEPNPFSCYSSEPQVDPPSPGYMSDHSSPGKVQISSPNKPSKKSMTRTEKELGRLQDRMSELISPVGTRRKRKNRLGSLKDVDANDEMFNESVHATPLKNVIALHSDSPLADVRDEILPSTPKIEKNESVNSCKLEETGLQSKIRLPRELTNLKDASSLSKIKDKMDPELQTEEKIFQEESSSNENSFKQKTLVSDKNMLEVAEENQVSSIEFLDPIVPVSVSGPVTNTYCMVATTTSPRMDSPMVNLAENVEDTSPAAALVVNPVVAEDADVDDPFVFNDKEMYCKRKYIPLKRKFPVVSLSLSDDVSKKSKLDSIFDSLFPPTKIADETHPVHTSGESQELGEPSNDVKKEKLDNIFDSIFGKVITDSVKGQLESSSNCSDDCPYRNCYGQASATAVKITRQRIGSMSTSELHQFLLTRLNIQHELGINTTSTFVFEQRSFCYNAILDLFQISKYMVRTVKHEHLSGQTFVIHGNKGKFYGSNKKDFAIGFITNFAKIHAENMPDRIVLRLPHYLNIKEIYCYYKSSVPVHLQLVERTFYDVFKTCFGDASRLDDFLPRIIFLPSNTHPMCNECYRITNLRKTVKTESEMIYALSCKKTHLLRVRRMYLQFCYRRELAIRFPSDYLHIGMNSFLLNGPQQISQK